MKKRETQTLSDSISQRAIHIHQDSPKIRNAFSFQGIEGFSNPIDVPVRTLSPISHNTMNSLKISSSPSRDTKNVSKNHTTIRSVGSDPVNFDSDVGRRPQVPSTMPHSTKTLPSLSTVHPHPPLSWQNSTSNSVTHGLPRTISAEFGLKKQYSNTSLHALDESSASSNGNTALQGGSGQATPQWSSAVGRANLGKSGRVIERLMGENDMLKRDLNVQRLQAEESKQAVRMAEGKMDVMAQEFEGKLHEAAINKTLLRRKERQVDDLKSQIDGEKQRAVTAAESERMWREAMEQMEEETKKKVEEAQIYAALMEGRNKAMTSHWKEQGAEVSRTVSKLEKEIETIVEDRRSDDRRMNMLQALCDQQAKQLLSLQKEKEGIRSAFEAYKREQEQALVDIKHNAQSQEEQNNQIIMESQKVLGELKWALGVKTNVRGAQ